MAGKNRRLVLLDKLQLSIEEESIPDPPPDGIVVKVAYAGICHTDTHVYLQALIPLPRILGHETSGTIHSIGTDILKGGTDFKTADRVVVYPWGQCNKCDLCLNDISQCRNMCLPTGFNHLDSFEYGFYKDGGYQQYTTVHDVRFLIKVPDAIPLDIACMVPCSGITAHHAATKLKQSVDDALRIRDHARVAVIGAGGLALWAIPIIKSMYPPTVQVTAIDIVKEKLDDAKAQGADDVFQWSKDDTVEAVVDQYLKAFGTEDFIDGAIDFTGIASVQMRTFELLNVGATIALVGLTEPTMAAFPHLGMTYKAVSVKGLLVGSRADVSKVFSLVLDNKVKPPPTTMVNMEQIEEVLVKLSKGTMRGRAVCKMSQIEESNSFPNAKC